MIFSFLINCNKGSDLNFRFLDRLVSTLEEKKHHEAKLKEGLKDLTIRRMELQNSLSSSWPKQVSSFLIQRTLFVLLMVLCFIQCSYVRFSG